MATGYESLWPGSLSPLALMTVDTEGKWGPARHLSLLNRYLLKVATGEIRRLIITMPPRHSKPVAVDAMVQMGDGTYRRLADVKVGDEVITHLGRPRKVLEVHEQGRLPVYRVTTELGRSVAAAGDHPFLTAEGWKNVEDIKEGDGLAVLPGATFPDGSARVIEEFKLLGYLMGDGCVVVSGREKTPSGRGFQSASFTNQDQKILRDFKDVVERLGYKTHVPRISASGTESVSLKGGARDWIRESGISGMSSHTKRVPDWCYRGSREKIAAFVAAYFDCDGTVNKRGNSRKDCCAELGSVSRSLLRDTQKLMTRLGVRTRLAEKPARYNGVAFMSWRLTVTSIDDAADFWGCVPLVGKKAVRMAEWAPRRATFKGRYIADRVVAIKRDGEEECRCLTVEDDHTFTVEDIVVHNSSLCSHYFPAWYLGMFPDRRILLASYGAEFASEWGRKARDVMERQCKRFNVEVRADTKAADAWMLKQGGSMHTTGVGGQLTGRGANVLLVDDACKDMAQAVSPTYQQRTYEWFTSTALTRLEPQASVCVIGTRWGVNDLAGKLLDKQKLDGSNEWQLVNFPAIAEENDALGRQPGEALWPERYPVSELEKIRSNVGEYVWSSLYQQRPYSLGGNLWKPERCSWYESLGDGFRLQNGAAWLNGQCPRFLVVDPSVGKKSDSDPTAMGVFAQTPDGFLLVLEMLSERMPITQLVPRMCSMATKWGVDYVACEANGFQVQVVREARQVLKVPVRELEPHGKSKYVRAYPGIVRMENGQVALPRKEEPWLGPFVLELAAWTGDERELDNQVDVAAYACRELMNGMNVLPTGPIQPQPRAPEPRAESRLQPNEEAAERWRRRRWLGYGR